MTNSCLTARGKGNPPVYKRNNEALRSRSMPEKSLL
jgi:hypothetical protein